MDNVPLLRQAFDLLSYTVSPISSSSHLCLDAAVTLECNIPHTGTEQMAWFAFQVVQIRLYLLLYNGRSCTVCMYIVCFVWLVVLLLFVFVWFGFVCLSFFR